jgi:hypothetical protein
LIGLNDAQQQMGLSSYRAALSGLRSRRFSSSAVKTALHGFLSVPGSSAVSVFYWDHGSSRSMCVPDGLLKLNDLAELFVQVLKVPWKDVFFYVDSCGSGKLVSDALKEALKKAFVEPGENESLTIMTTSNGANPASHTRIILIGPNMHQGGQSQAFRQLCRGLQPHVFLLNLLDFADGVNRGQLACRVGGFEFGIHGYVERPVASVLDPRFPLGDVPLTALGDDRQVGVEGEARKNRLDVVELEPGSGQLVASSPLSVSVYREWEALRATTTTATRVKSQISLEAALGELRKRHSEWFDDGCTRYGSDEASQALIVFAAEVCADGQWEHILLLPLFPVLEQGVATVDEVTQELTLAFESLEGKVAAAGGGPRDGV